MTSRLYKKGRDYFNFRNYKNETIFHVAAKYNSVESLKILVDDRDYTEELLKKDYLGNTPLHLAAKKGNKSILEYFLLKA
jgi:ankyrin repeat protein